MAQTQAPTRVTHVGTVLLNVDDQDRSLEFYQGILGFEVRADVRMGDGYRWLEVAPAGAVTTIALCMPMPNAPAANRDNASCCLNSTDIDADHAYLKSKGVDVDDVMRQGDPVPPMFFFRDPDKNILLFVGYTPEG